ncbi:hypothetical protein PYJP_02230 [Pyrofollis japonicus]|uniref:hypothetical protein n=1 Tax=Pyrofollis japonicus TaxID=3060460 RepID=UPI00295C0E36|nr:hypothetical protein [Pyrofollis japonicus]BEP16871.1 hypothetical protein PYJP_02230 [Pyrofollis japonicus]
MGRENRSNGGKKRPLFATGEVVGDYEPLYKYWEEAGQKASESVLSAKDFEELRRIVVDQGVRRLDELLEKLKQVFRNRVDPEAARRALSKYYGVEVDTETAVDRVAGILAGWLVEAATEWNILSLRPTWQKRDKEQEENKNKEGS